jgi:putative transposase
MPIPLTTLLATLSSIFRSRAALELENLALRHQIGVLQRSKRKRPKLTSCDRLLWICLCRLWRDWRSALAIVKPETVIAWHRAGFCLFWTWKVRRGQPGRPLISREVRDLIRRMCRENPNWGAPRIHGELLKLGIDIAESSVSKSMVRGRKPPSQTWRTSWRITPSSWSPSTSSPCPPSVFKSSTCFWFWPMTGIASSTSM